MSVDRTGGQAEADPQANAAGHVQDGGQVEAGPRAEAGSQAEADLEADAGGLAEPVGQAEAVGQAKAGPRAEAGLQAEVDLEAEAVGLAEAVGPAEAGGQVGAGDDVFAELTGQGPVVAELRRAAAAAADVLSGRADLRAGGMAHAWLLTGPPGSGRSVAARVFAAALLCPEQGCGSCPSCRQVRAGTHPDLMLVRPEGLSYGVKQTRDLVLHAATAPAAGRWHVVLFEDADRATEAAANALLKAIEEPAPRTVWLLCAPSAEDLPATIRSRCRLVVLRTPSSAEVADVLVGRDGVDPLRALAAARAAQGHIGRAHRLATDADAARRRDEVLRIPLAVTGVGPALAAAASLVGAAEEEARAVTEERDQPERDALRQAFGEGSTGKGVAKAVRGAAGALRELEDRQKSRATRAKRDTLEIALLDLAWFYRDVLAVQLGAQVELGNAGRETDLRKLAEATTPESTVRRIEAIMACRERVALNVAPLLAVEEMTLALLAG